MRTTIGLHVCTCCYSSFRLRELDHELDTLKKQVSDLYSYQLLSMHIQHVMCRCSLVPLIVYYMHGQISAKIISLLPNKLM